MTRPLIQLCPSDQPPFPTLMRSFSRAADRLGSASRTLYLKPSVNPAGPDPEAVYLNLQRPEHYGNSGHVLAAAIAQQPAPVQDALVLAHRYRSYRVARAANVPNAHTLVLAHEFGMLRRWQRRADRLLRGRGVTFAGVSQPVAEELAARTGQTVVLPNALDPTAALEQLQLRSQARTALGLADPRFTVGVIGRLDAVKRPALALQAFAVFRAQLAQHLRPAQPLPSAQPLPPAQRDAELLFIGNGTERPQLEQAAGDTGVRFTGFLEEPLRLLRGLDALLITTGQAEAFGLVALEAMIAGVPVISTPSAGVRFVTGKLGIFAADDSPAAIAAALEEVSAWRADQRSRWADAALARAREHFSIEALAQALAPHLT